MRTVTLLTLALSIAGLHTACSSCGETEKVDTDGAPKKPEDVAKLLKVPAGVEIEDSVDAKTDKVDWRVIKPDETGKGKLNIDFGADHGLTGKVSVKAEDYSDVASEAVTPDEQKYLLEWDAKADETYFAVIEASKAKSAYTLLFEVEPPKPVNPCDNVTCEDDQECQDGKCVEVKPAECTPKCKATMTCVNGECVSPCGGKCPSGQICNKRSNECVKDPCAGKTCPDGQRCSGGTCKDVPKPQCPKCKGTDVCNPATLKCEPAAAVPVAKCEPACAADEKCNGGKCEKVPLCGPLGAGVIQVIPNGSSSIIILNKGAGAQVKVGQSGTIGGVKGGFKITEVYPVRSKAIIDVDAATIGANKGATINRAACP